MEETTSLLERPKRKSYWSRLTSYFSQKKEATARIINLGQLPDEEFPPNQICNRKYNIIAFLPMVLYDQFRLFLNLYFLIMACSQFIPTIRIGYLYTYWGPLSFVISVTLFREIVDEFRRYRRDREVNNQLYDRVDLNADSESGYGHMTPECVPASSLRVGDIVMLQKGQRVPADMILLRTNETMGAVYIRTDQLDGETDWKLRMPVPSLQREQSNSCLLNLNVQIITSKPERNIHSFTGYCSRIDNIEALDITNTMWSGCVVASGQATGLVIYTGRETRSVMNNDRPRSKNGRLDLQVNNLTKVLFLAVILLSFFLIVLKSFNGPWYAFMFRFVLLFSYIIPISLRVNLELAKAFYSWLIQRDKSIEGTAMRSTNIPEELGRVQYILADKTGTLTKNEMVFQKLQLGDDLFDSDNFHEIETALTQYVTLHASGNMAESFSQVNPRKAWSAVVAMALCHNVTPVYDYRDTDADSSDGMSSSTVSASCGGTVPQQDLCDYQASSPDEVALVKWTDTMGISLYKRDLTTISVKLRALNKISEYRILELFPFSSEKKMMGIIVQEMREDSKECEITYYVKGADVALSKVLNSPSLHEHTKRLAEQGLRTLVVAKSTLTVEQFNSFKKKYDEARVRANNKEYIDAAMSKLHSDLELLAITGVEDRLAQDVPSTLKMLRTAGIKVWMLTGDKQETALCIARSLHLGGNTEWRLVDGPMDRLHSLVQQTDVNLVIEGDTLEWYLRSNSMACATLSLLSGLVVARCSPTQKALLAKALRGYGQVVLAVGDGGNDVPMIQEADIGVGISGVEGRAAALAGDVSTSSFKNVAPLLLVHGRFSTIRSAHLSLFIVHRGLIVSTMQAIFSVVFYFSSVSLYPGFLMVGYGTLYTMLPVLSLILDEDIPASVALKYPQLYKQISKGRQLSYKTFFIWTAISIYQGGVIMYGALILFEDQLIHIVEISFTALLLTELIMIALTVITWHPLMLAAEMASLAMYIATLCVFTSYFDVEFLKHWDFWWKVTTITAISCLPLYIVKFIRNKWRKRQYRHISTS